MIQGMNLREGAVLVTADKKLYLVAASHPKYGSFVRWITR